MKQGLLIATQNVGKLEEFKRYLGADFECGAALGTLDVEEDGASYFENALKKALAFYAHFQRPTLADDSGLEVDALDGRPGIHSARLGGPDLNWEARWKCLYEEIRASGKPAPHTARFVCVLCYYDGLNVPQFFQGKSSGRIADVPAGSGGFGYDPVFVSDLLQKTFAEADAREKEKASHRGEALRRFSVWWKTTHPTA